MATVTVGNTVAGAINDTQNADAKTVTPVTVPQGRVVSVDGWWDGNGGSQPVRAVAYADAAGSPGALLAVSDPVSVAGVALAVYRPSFSFPTAPLVPGGVIWIGYWAGAFVTAQPIMKETGSGSFKYQNPLDNVYSAVSPPSDPFGIVRGTIAATSLSCSVTINTGSALTRIRRFMRIGRGRN